jgi:hypothetical protein
VKYKSRDIWKWPVESGHITYSNEIHWRLAAKWNGISFKKFLKEEGSEQSRMVAAYETAMQMEAVVSHDANRKAAKKTNRRR